MPTCWICQVNEATTREHEVQASSIKELMPGVAQDNPILVRKLDLGGKQKSKRIFSPAANFLKPHEPDLCVACNSSVTQPDDEMWSEMLRRLLAFKNPFQDVQAPIGEWFEPFPDKTARALLGVHLHWAKKLGCYMRQAGVPRSLAELGDAIVHRRSVSNFYIAFSIVRVPWSETDGGRTSIKMGMAGERAVDVRTVYYFGNIAVALAYFEAGYLWGIPAHSWHPDWPTRALTLKFSDLVEN